MANDNQMRPGCKDASIFYGITLSWCAKHEHIVVVFSGPVAQGIPSHCVEAARATSETVRDVLVSRSLLTEKGIGNA